MRLNLVLVLLLILMNCTSKQEQRKICRDKDLLLDCKKVSFNSLINSPDEFEDKYIELEGYLNWKFEHVGFFKSKTKNSRAGAVSLDMADTLAKQIDRYYPNGISEKISIKGIFKRTYHRLGFFGELNNVTCIEIK